MELEFGAPGCEVLVLMNGGGYMRWQLIAPDLENVFRTAQDLGGSYFTCPLNVDGWGVFRIAGEGYDMLKHFPTQEAAEMWMIHCGA